MVVENEQQFQFSQFVEAENLPSLDDRSLNLDELPDQNDEGSSLLTTTGIIAAVSGLAIFLATNFTTGLNSMTSLLVGTGIVALGIGFGRTLLKLFKPRGISLPSIKVKRKAELRNATSAKTFNMPAALGSFREKKSGFAKSLTDKVFTGVCGGIAESSGISSSVLRAIFIAAFAITGGTAVFIYIALAVLMRDGGDTIINKLNGRR